ncbi:MAG TPA: N-acetylmuramoyl-L-alanine amidase [Bryobacteraceae bacterium]|nr:N-acetylmuramoyl-L-alanine amidase [Bryobacteraceae bacterium]
MPHLPREHSRARVLRPLGWMALLMGSVVALTGASDEPHRVTAVRFWSLGDITRVAIEIDGDFQVLSDHLSDPERVFFDLTGTKPALGPKAMTVIPVGDKLIQQIRVAEPRRNVTRVVLDLTGVSDTNVSRLENPNRLIIEVRQPRHGVENAISDPKPGDRRPSTAPPVSSAAASKPAPVAVADPLVEGPRPSAPAALNAKLSAGTDHDNTPLPFPKENPAPVVSALLAPPPPLGIPAALAVANPPEVSPLAKRTVALATSEPVSVQAKRNVPLVTGEAAPLPSKHSLATDSPETALSAKINVPLVTGEAAPPPAKHSLATASPEAALPAKRNTTGDRSMVRVLGLKIGRIVLDPGHGGHDTGTVGPEGLREKDLVLDVAKRLGALIEDRMGSEVIFTRTDDTFIPLERRTEIANEAKADLFLSIHANSSPMRSAAGVETYYLSFTTSRTALDLAARENAGSEETLYDLQDLLQKIALKDKVEESRDFATRVQTALFALSAKSNAHAKDRGIKKAPFVVLIGANMPSVLAEIGFISNARDETTMKRAEYRERIAEALFKGVSGYASTLSHFQVAQGRSSSSP